MTNPKKNGDLMLRVRYDSGAILVGPAIITDEENMLVSLGGAASMLVRRADGSLPLHVAAVEMLSDGSMPEGVESTGSHSPSCPTVAGATSHGTHTATMRRR